MYLLLLRVYNCWTKGVRCGGYIASPCHGMIFTARLFQYRWYSRRTSVSYATGILLTRSQRCRLVKTRSARRPSLMNRTDSQTGCQPRTKTHSHQISPCGGIWTENIVENLLARDLKPNSFGSSSLGEMERFFVSRNIYSIRSWLTKCIGGMVLSMLYVNMTDALHCCCCYFYCCCCAYTYNDFKILDKLSTAVYRCVEASVTFIRIYQPHICMRMSTGHSYRLSIGGTSAPLVSGIGWSWCCCCWL